MGTVRGSRAVLCASLLAFGSGSYANGRFPSAGHVVVRASSIVVRSTLGLFVSRDGGASFAWVCEEALGYRGSWDPPVSLAGSGTLVGLPDGLLRGADDCAFERVAEADGDLVLDLATSPDGARVVAAVEGSRGARVLVSRDGAARFDAFPLGLTDASLTTLDVAPSAPDRVWAVATRSDRASLLRSDDGGRSFVVAREAIPDARTAWLSAVHPGAPSSLWVRVPRGAGTALLATGDGGLTWREALSLPDAMAGFAVSDDGRRVWVGGPSSGLWRATDGGAFERIDAAPVLCLRYHQGALYVCTDHTRDGVSLARVVDADGRREPLLQYRDVEPTPDCPGSSPVSSRCGSLWRDVRATLLRAVDGGTPDAATDVALDTAARDTAARDDASDAPDSALRLDAALTVAPRADGDCGCRAGASSPREPLTALFALAAFVRRRRRLGD